MESVFSFTCLFGKPGNLGQMDSKTHSGKETAVAEQGTGKRHKGKGLEKEKLQEIERGAE